MGIYLGANALGGGSSGSGGGALPDPTYMRRYNIGHSYPMLKGSQTDAEYATNAAFWTKYGYLFDTASASNNTWVTITDITSAANGGILVHAIGPSNTSSGTTDFKITIDGEEYSFSTTPGWNYSRATMGVGLERPSTSSGYTASWLSSHNNHYTFFPGSVSDAAATNGGFIRASNKGGIEALASISTTLHDVPYVRFESSCKVEIRCSSITSGASIYTNVGCTTMLL